MIDKATLSNRRNQLLPPCHSVANFFSNKRVFRKLFFMGTGFFFGKGEPYLAKSGPYTIPAQVFDRKKKRNLHIKYGT